MTEMDPHTPLPEKEVRGPSIQTENAWSPRGRLSIGGLRILLGFIAFLCAALQARAGAALRTMTTDGIVFLEIGEALLAGNWSEALNAFWSPLYAWLLGLFLWMVGGDPYWEPALVQAANLLIFVLTLLCFDFFWRELLRTTSRRGAEPGSGRSEILSDAAWWAIGYGLFSWTSLELMKVWHLSSALLTAAALYLSGGCVLRVRSSVGAGAGSFFLGISLAFGYLSDHLFLLLAPIFLLCVLQGDRPGWARIRPAVIAGLALAALAGTVLFATSMNQGRFVALDNLRVHYAWAAYHMPTVHWQGGAEGLGQPLHPTRQVAASPDVFTFTAPVPGTYPPRTDPSYWMRGLELRWSSSAQIRLLAENFEVLFGRIVRDGGAALAGILILLLIGCETRSAWRRLAAFWPVWLPALSALALTCLLGRLEPGRVAPHLVFLLGSLLAAAHGGQRRPDRVVRVTAAVVVSYLYFYVLVFSLGGHVLRGLAYEGIHSFAVVSKRLDHSQWEISRGLTEVGVEAGERVAIVGGEANLHWARLAGLQVGAEIPTREATLFWSLDAHQRRSVYALLRREGIAAVVTDAVPAPSMAEGWLPLPTMNYRVLPLEPSFFDQGREAEGAAEPAAE